MKEKVKKKKSKVIIIVIVIAAIIMILIGTAISKMKSGIEEALNVVEVETVAKRDLSDSISLSGTAEGISKTNVTSKAIAEITAVNVQIGDEVQAGDVLCTLESTEIEEKIAEAEKSATNESALSGNTSKQNAQALEDAKADQGTQLAAAAQQITDAQQDYDSANAKLAEDKKSLETKQTELAAAETASKSAKKAADKKPGDTNLQTAYTTASAAYESKKGEVEALQAAISEEESALTALSRAVTTARTAYNGTKSETDKLIAAAQNTVDMEKYQSADSTIASTLKELRDQLEECQVVAPCSGVITAVNVSVGDNNTGELTLVTIEDTSSMKINATVDEADILRIEEGMPAIVTTGATGDEEIVGSVTRVVRVGSQTAATNDMTGMSSPVSGFAAEITVPQSELLVGMSAKVKVIIKEKKDVLAVPYDLIMTDDDGDSYVMIAEKQKDGMSKAVRCNVTVGEEVDYYTEITGGDLKAGDALIYDSSVVEGTTFTQNQLYSDGNNAVTTVETEVEGEQ